MPDIKHGKNALDVFDIEDDFVQEVSTKKYRIVDQEIDFPEPHPSGKWIIKKMTVSRIVSNGGPEDVKKIDPLGSTTSPLFRVFSDIPLRYSAVSFAMPINGLPAKLLQETPEDCSKNNQAILDFTNQYGLLCARKRPGTQARLLSAIAHLDENKRVPFISQIPSLVSPVSAKDEVVYMRSFLHLWEAFQSGNQETLQSCIDTDDKGNYLIQAPGLPVLDTGPLIGAGVTYKILKETDQDLLSDNMGGNFFKIAKALIAVLLDWKLEQYPVRAKILLDEDLCSYVRMMPTSLISGMWYQIYGMVIRTKQRIPVTCARGAKCKHPNGPTGFGDEAIWSYSAKYGGYAHKKICFKTWMRGMQRKGDNDEDDPE